MTYCRTTIKHFSLHYSEILIGPLFFLLDRFLWGDVRVRGSEGGMARVSILELSSTTGKYSDQIITSPSSLKVKSS